jgi:hypothetical protein
MTGPDAAVVFAWGLTVMLALGLVSAWFARLSEQFRCPALLRGAFLALLILVGATTLVSAWLGSGWWLGCGATLSLMVLTVTCDFRRTQAAAAW